MNFPTQLVPYDDSFLAQNIIGFQAVLEMKEDSKKPQAGRIEYCSGTMQCVETLRRLPIKEKT
jgi:hypothetical protein